MKQEQLRAGKNKGMEAYTVQTLVVGSGAAGLNAAISLRRQGVEDVAILTEGQLLGTSRNTGSDKQTYYKTTTCGEDGDSVRKMAQTLFAGGAMDGDLALAEAASSLRGFYHLVEIGVPFPFNAAGEYVGYKTDHDPLQRGTSAGPLTSRYMTEALFAEAKQLNIPVLDGLQVIEILTETETDGSVRTRGVLALNRRAGVEKESAYEALYVLIAAENVVYATGGEAGMYLQSVYPVSQIGGTGTALRAGVLGKNLTESQYGIASLKFRWNLSGTYQQVLPRYISTDTDGNDEREFLQEYFPDAESLLTAVFRKGYQWPFDPRKVSDYGSSLVDLLVYQETVLKGRRVWLDYMHNPSVGEKAPGIPDFSAVGEEAYEYLSRSGALQNTPIERLAHMNPAAIELYASHNIDLCSEYLEIAVCAQHNNGGLSGNEWWESNIRHFFPVGEVNGSHGVYRPGGSALNSGQVGSLRAAQYIAACYREEPLSAAETMKRCEGQIAEAMSFGLMSVMAGMSGGSLFDAKEERETLGRRMSAAGACIREPEQVRAAIGEAREQLKRLKGQAVIHGLGDAAETRETVVMRLASYYRVRDLLVSQITYLSAISDYMECGGKSRGSYLIVDPDGQKPLEELPEQFRFSLDGDAHAAVIQEIRYDAEKCSCSWRPVRPLPDPDIWFENVWRDCRSGAIFRKEQTI